MARAGSAPWLYPIEAHHYSPVIAALFKLTAQGTLGAAAWHLLALAAHGVNILLVWLIFVRGLAIARPYAWVATMLFALAAPGYEAIAWAAGLGYVLVESTLLAAVYLSLVARGPCATALLRWGTLLLQLAALAIWDWGALLLPIVAACWWFRSCRAATAATCPPLPSGEGRGEGEVGRAVDLAASAFRDSPHPNPLPKGEGTFTRLAPMASLFWPAAVAWVGGLAVKFSFGCSAGYHRSFDLVRYAYYFLTSPIRCLYPNGPASFYWSAAGLASTVALAAFLAARSRRDARILLLGGIFLFSQLPYTFLAAPTSRYFYLSAPFFFAAVVLAVAGWKSRAGKIGPLAALLVLHACWAHQRAELYLGAYGQSQAIYRVLAAIPAGDGRLPLVVVDLPDSYGPPDLMWGPNMWRNGMPAFPREIIRVSTPECPFTWPGCGFPQLSRAAILARYQGHAIYAVHYAAAGDWRRFQVDCWSAGGDRTCRR